MVKIDERLKAVCSMVTDCSVLLDIGSDHAYVPIRLFLDGKIDKALITDVNRGPLETAERNIENAGFSDRVSLILSDGFENVCEDFDTVSICGMGGELIIRILLEGQKKVRGADSIILQPMNSVRETRLFLYENGYTITDEDLVRDGTHYYNIIKAENGRDERKYEDIFFDLGYRLFENRHPLFEEYLSYIENKKRTIIKNCSGQKSQKAIMACREAEEYINKLLGVKLSYES